MTPKPSTNQSGKRIASFTMDDLLDVVERLKTSPGKEQVLKVTYLEYMQIMSMTGFHIQIKQSGPEVFGMRIEIEEAGHWPAQTTEENNQC